MHAILDTYEAFYKNYEESEIPNGHCPCCHMFKRRQATNIKVAVSQQTAHDQSIGKGTILMWHEVKIIVDSNLNTTGININIMIERCKTKSDLLISAHGIKSSQKIYEIVFLHLFRKCIFWQLDFPSRCVYCKHDICQIFYT